MGTCGVPGHPCRSTGGIELAGDVTGQSDANKLTSIDSVPILGTAIPRGALVVNEAGTDFVHTEITARTGFTGVVGAQPDVDPGSGNWAVDNANPSLATEIYISEVDQFGCSIQFLIDNLSSGVYVLFRRLRAPSANFASFEITGTLGARVGYAAYLITPRDVGGTALVAERYSMEVWPA